MATPSTLSQAELLPKLLAVATANTGTASTATDGTITGALTAIKAKWLLGGRTAVTAESVEAYLETKFGDRLEAARAAMTTLARAYRPRDLAAEAFALYEAFRPAVPEGVKGWGAKGVLDLGKIRSLAKG